MCTCNAFAYFTDYKLKEDALSQKHRQNTAEYTLRQYFEFATMKSFDLKSHYRLHIPRPFSLCYIILLYHTSRQNR